MIQIQGVIMQNSISNYIVNGYHANTPIPKKAKNAGLSFRFALILDSYHPDIDYMHFQDSFFLACLVQIAKKIDYDTITIYVNDKSYQSIEVLRRHLLATPEEDRQPPKAIRFERGGKLICLEETEFWMLCGGDAPYSDSYTASFYTKENMADEFIDACLAASKIEGNGIKEIIQASSEPVKQTFWKKIFKWI